MKYSNSNYILLGYIIEKITRKPYQKVAFEKIFKPLEMKNSGFDFAGLNSENKSVGYNFVDARSASVAIAVHSTVSYAAGGMFATAEDLLRWHNGLLNNTILNLESKQKAFQSYKNNFG